MPYPLKQIRKKTERQGSRILATLFAALVATHAFGQTESAETRLWSFSLENMLYFMPQDFFYLPVFKADTDKLHLEARYNYEDLETFSAWVGYHFSGGKNFTYNITPMVGGVVGAANGMAPGLQITLTYGKFEVYSESEYLFYFKNQESNFFYAWTDITYAFTDFFWAGLSAQRLRPYKTERELDRGLFVGGGYKNLEFNGYLYDAFAEEKFWIVALILTF
jgi:hypothetical protein